jgi:hypothetical protein
MLVREDKMLVCRDLDETWDGTDEPLPVRYLPRTQLSRPSSCKTSLLSWVADQEMHVRARRNGFAYLVIIRGESMESEMRSSPSLRRGSGAAASGRL